MAVYGDLDDLELPDILAIISRHGKSGRLRLSTGVDEVALVFDRGTIVSVEASDITLRLGQLLIRHGALSPEQLERALMLQALSTPPARIGDVLVQWGFVTRRQITDAVALQLRSSLFRLLVQRGGTFAFTAKPVAVTASRPPDLPVEQVVLEAVRLADEWLSAHPEPEVVVLGDGEIAPDDLAGLSDGEQRLLVAMLNGVSTLDALALAVQLPTTEFDAVLDGLCRRGLAVRVVG